MLNPQRLGLGVEIGWSRYLQSLKIGCPESRRLQSFTKCLKLEPTRSSSTNRPTAPFSAQGTGALDYGYHGTRQANIPSILGTGLKVPGNESGVRVANGSAHGVGIYTGPPGDDLELGEKRSMMVDLFSSFCAA